MAKDDFQIPFRQLVSILSDAVDLISPALNNHHKQVAYIALQIGKALNLSSVRLTDLTMAALLHDIGALSLRERVELLEFEEKDPYRHTIAGYVLLKDQDLLRGAGEIIKHHHLAWRNGLGREYKGEAVPRESHILYLADRIAVSLRRDTAILNQVEAIGKKIKEQTPRRFCPQFVEVFAALAEREAFWLDLMSPDIEKRLTAGHRGPARQLNLREAFEITKVFARVIDFRSRFTSVHSSGVGAVAGALAEKMNWSEGDCLKMVMAGNLHDLGKLAIPNEILAKPGKLTRDQYNIMKTHAYHSYYLLNRVDGLEDVNEYASFHHERMDGSGYPFRMRGRDLKDGAKIMAVADVLTAITEDRPYRKGMREGEALELVERKGLDSKLDAEIVSLTRENFGEINAIREKAQREAASTYRAFREEINRVRRYYSSSI